MSCPLLLFINCCLSSSRLCLPMCGSAERAPPVTAKCVYACCSFIERNVVGYNSGVGGGGGR